MAHYFIYYKLHTVTNCMPHRTKNSLQETPDCHSAHLCPAVFDGFTKNLRTKSSSVILRPASCSCLRRISTQTSDCHSEPIRLDGLTKNLHTKVTFQILRGIVFAGIAQNDANCNCLFFFFVRGEELFSARECFVAERRSIRSSPLPLSLI